MPRPGPEGRPGSGLLPPLLLGGGQNPHPAKSIVVNCPFSALEGAPRPPSCGPGPAGFGLEVVFTKPRSTKGGSVHPRKDGGPKDKQNEALCSAVLGDPELKGKADFCVPILVPAKMAYPLWERVSPELAELGVLKPGRNRRGQQQFRDRDICVVQFDEQSDGRSILRLSRG